MNALKHGLRGESHSLPNEDAALVDDLLDAWYAFYQPASPGECELIDQAVFSAVQKRRGRRFVAAALRDQIGKAVKAWDEAREDEVGGLVRLLQTDPATAARGLGRTGHGCRWLIGRWEQLDARLERDGGWSQADRDEAVRLLGASPDRETLHGRSDAPAELYRRAAAVQLLEEDDPFAKFSLRDYVLKHYAPDARPSWAPSEEDVANEEEQEKADAAETLAWLRAQVAAQLAGLREREPRLRLDYDEPDRAAAGERALLLDGPEGAKLMRYERMHELAFHRAYTTFVKDRKASAETGLSPGAPNEANDPETTNSTPENKPTCVVPEGPSERSHPPASGPTPPAEPAAAINPRATLTKVVAPNEARRAGPRSVTWHRFFTSVDANGAGVGLDAGPVALPPDAGSGVGGAIGAAPLANPAGG